MQVRLIGYCVEGSLFLIYEFIDNGNLSNHLRGSGEHYYTPVERKHHLWVSHYFTSSFAFFFFSGKDPLPWSTRVQIALDSARGLEYIHEHTVPVYIHRDIKPANILLDKKFRAKVVKVSECGR